MYVDAYATDYDASPIEWTTGASVTDQTLETDYVCAADAGDWPSAFVACWVDYNKTVYGLKY